MRCATLTMAHICLEELQLQLLSSCRDVGKTSLSGTGNHCGLGSNELLNYCCAGRLTNCCRGATGVVTCFLLLHSAWLVLLKTEKYNCLQT